MTCTRRSVSLLVYKLSPYGIYKNIHNPTAWCYKLKFSASPTAEVSWWTMIFIEFLLSTWCTFPLSATYFIALNISHTIFISRSDSSPLCVMLLTKHFFFWRHSMIGCLQFLLVLIPRFLYVLTLYWHGQSLFLVLFNVSSELFNVLSSPAVCSSNRVLLLLPAGLESTIFVTPVSHPL